MLITRQQIIDIFNAIKTAVEGTLTTDSTVQNWPTKQQVNLSQDGTDNKVEVDNPTGESLDVQLTGSTVALPVDVQFHDLSTDPLPVIDLRDQRGLATSRPLATAVVAGVTYWSVDTGVIEVSDGTNWVVV